jgi:hypothetical protein
MLDLFKEVWGASFCFFIADYMFSNEHINFLITYTFDFRNEELLSYYISFLRYAFLVIVMVVVKCLLYPWFRWLWFSNGMFCGLWRAISGKLDKNTISLLVKTQNVGLSVFCTLFILHDTTVLIFYYKF